MTNCPTDSEIIIAVEQLFRATASFNAVTRLNALIPTDLEISVSNSLPQGKVVTDIPLNEFDEVNNFVSQFEDFIRLGPTEENAIRIKLIVYCHIMEADFWPTLIWNQLRLLSQEQPSWSFTRITSKGKILVCEYPREKFEEIRLLANRVEQPIGDIIFRIWDNDLRNAFSHSGSILSG